MSDQITAWIRTTVPMLVGPVLTLLAKRHQIVLDEETTATVSTVVAFGLSVGWYTIAKALEARWPKAGRLLGVAKAPTYADTEKAVRARIAELAGLPLPEFQALVAANPAVIPEDERDGCSHATVSWPPAPDTSNGIILEPDVYDETT